MNRLFLQRVGLPALLLGACVLLAGCAVDQAAEVATWRSVLDAGAALKGPSGVAMLPAGAELNLRQALDLAARNNEQLMLAGEDYLQTLIAKDRSYSAFLPTLAFAPSYMRQEKNSIGKPLEPTEAIDVPITGDIKVNPVRDISASRAAGADAEAGRARLLDAESVLLLDVAKTFYQILAAERQLAVLDHTIVVQDRHVADTRVQVEAGAARPLDLSQAVAQLAQIRVRRERASTDAANGRAMLAVLLGVPVVDGPLRDDLTAPRADWTTAQLLPLSEVRRQDLQAARSGVEAASHGLESAWGEYFPSVSLNVTGFLTRQSFPDDVGWSSLLGVQLPIFTAGLAHQDVRAAYSRLRQAHTRLTLTRREVQRDLTVALEDLQSDERQLAELDREVAAARDALGEASAGFSAGTQTSLDHLVAQDRLLQAELDQTRATYTRDVDYLRLLRSAGVLDARVDTNLAAEAHAATDALATDAAATDQPESEPAPAQPSARTAADAS